MGLILRLLGGSAVPWGIIAAGGVLAGGIALFAHEFISAERSSATAQAEEACVVEAANASAAQIDMFKAQIEREREATKAAHDLVREAQERANAAHAALAAERSAHAQTRSLVDCEAGCVVHLPEEAR